MDNWASPTFRARDNLAKKGDVGSFYRDELRKERAMSQDRSAPILKQIAPRKLVAP